MAPVAPPSGKLVKLVKADPFKVPVSGVADAARIMTSAPPAPLCVETVNMLLLSRSPAPGLPMAVPEPPINAPSCTPLAQVKDANALQVSANAVRERINSKGMEIAISFDDRRMGILIVRQIYNARLMPVMG